MLFLIALTACAFSATAAEDDDEPYIVYANGVTSERNLPLCAGPREACNVVRQRFWLPPIVHRICKCPDRTVCPTEFTDLSDKRTIAFNARAQLKFCSRIGELEYCEENKVAAKIRSNGIIYVYCYCSLNHFYERLHKNSTAQYFKCQPYGSCQKNDFCGYISASSYETYHICTCPLQHICIMKDRRKTNIQEFLYKGPAYKGICTARN